MRRPTLNLTLVSAWCSVKLELNRNYHCSFATVNFSFVGSIAQPVRLPWTVKTVSSILKTAVVETAEVETAHSGPLRKRGYLGGTESHCGDPTRKEVPKDRCY